LELEWGNIGEVGWGAHKAADVITTGHRGWCKQLQTNFSQASGMATLSSDLGRDLTSTNSAVSFCWITFWRGVSTFSYPIFCSDFSKFNIQMNNQSGLH